LHLTGCQHPVKRRSSWPGCALRRTGINFPGSLFPNKYLVKVVSDGQRICRWHTCPFFRRRSGVQGSILVPGLHLGRVLTRKASASSGLIQNLEPSWQLFGKMSILKENFGSLMPSLSLTLNVEPWTCERLLLFLSIWSKHLKSNNRSIIYNSKKLYHFNAIADFCRSGPILLMGKIFLWCQVHFFSRKRLPRQRGFRFGTPPFGLRPHKQGSSPPWPPARSLRLGERDQMWLWNYLHILWTWLSTTKSWQARSGPGVQRLQPMNSAPNISPIELKTNNT